MKIACVYRAKSPEEQQFMPPEGFLVEAPLDNVYTPENLKAIAEADAILAWGSYINAQLLGAAKKCRMIQTTGAGYDKIDLAAAKQHGIIVCNNGDNNSDRVADFAMLMILATMRNFLPMANALAAGDWEASRKAGALGVAIAGKTLGIVGFGNIGSRLAKRAVGFDMKLLYNDIKDVNGDVARATGARKVEKAELFAQSDVVSIHTPHDASTEHMVNAQVLASMKPGAYLVCSARGRIVDESALRDALESGHLAAAGLDVFATEPLPADNPLRGAPNLIMTPHLAGHGADTMGTTMDRAAENIRRYVLHDQQPRNVIQAP